LKKSGARNMRSLGVVAMPLPKPAGAERLFVSFSSEKESLSWSHLPSSSKK
jgi:hypothetical protein